MLFAGMKGIRRIHCVGVGGAGMSGIAEILHAQGYHVTGSDLGPTTVTARLIQLGISVSFGHNDHALVSQADLLVYSSAISSHNCEWQWAKNRKIPCLSRGQMLGILAKGHVGIAVAGTHGKTSTVGLMAQLLRQHHLDPTIVIGGYLKSIKSHAAFGRSEYFITEADESDGSLLFLQPEIAVVTRVDEDHLGYYEYDFNRLVHTYHEFIEHSTGWVVLCEDDPILRQMIAQGLSRSVLTYGFETSAMIRGIQRRQSSRQLSLTVLREKCARLPLPITVPFLQNAYNVLAAVAVATLLAIPDDIIQAGLEEYTGVARRLEWLGEVLLPQGKVAVIDDYGHHPREIEATVQAIRQAWPQRRLVLVFQPHRYTRTRDLLTAFADVLARVADCLLLLPIYAAHEVPIVGIDHTVLASAIRQQGGEPILVEVTSLNHTLRQCLEKDDIVLFQGAGTIGQMARDFQTTWMDSEENSRKESL
jgi:UDP-N-acetylmuramate--alanine ligase